jgi:hypothetical protein
MTVVFSAVSKNCIVMAADSAVTRDFESGTREYVTERKLYMVEGVGCITTWGGRDGSNLGMFLTKEWSGARGRTVSDLARSVHHWLVDECRPDDGPRADVGYHIAGFMADGLPALYHSFWNVPGDASSYGSYTLQLIGPKVTVLSSFTMAVARLRIGSSTRCFKKYEPERTRSSLIAALAG